MARAQRPQKYAPYTLVRPMMRAASSVHDDNVVAALALGVMSSEHAALWATAGACGGHPELVAAQK